MAHPTSAAAGWYPDAGGNGTRYWDGSRWTDDTRPPRRPFSAGSAHRGWGIGLTAFGGLGLLAVPQQLMVGEPVGGESGPVGYVVFCLALVALGVYLLRGQGPSTKAVQERLARERAAANSHYEARRRQRGQAAGNAVVVNVTVPGDSAALAAQVQAVSSPETAEALRKLQDLLYTRTITDAEFQAAKDRLLGDHSVPDQYTQIQRLAELHRAGILADAEFADAKARVLGL